MTARIQGGGRYCLVMLIGAVFLINLGVVGIGWAMFFVSLISCCYYNMLVAYSFFYMFASFASDVPWRDCDNTWNTAGQFLYNYQALFTRTDTEPITDNIKCWVALLPMRVFTFSKIGPKFSLKFGLNGFHTHSAHQPLTQC